MSEAVAETPQEPVTEATQVDTTTTVPETPTGTTLGGQVAAETPAVEQGTTWKDSLPEEFKNDPSLQPITSVENLVKSFVNAQKMIGSDKFIVPGKYATKDEWNALYNKLGRPEEADKYELQVDKKQDEDFVKTYKQWAHEAGLSNAQAQTILKNYNEFAEGLQQNTTTQMQANQEAEMNSLRQQWGDQFEANAQLAAVAAQEIIAKDPSFKEFFTDPAVGDNPNMIRLMERVGRMMQEDELKGKTEGITGFSSVSADDAQQRINQIMGDLEGAYFDPNHPDHKRTVEEVTKLHSVKRAGGQNII